LLTVPGYTFIKGYTDSIQKSEETAKSLIPVLVKFDDNSQIGFEVERLENSQVVVFLPGAPNPWSGSVAYFDAERVKQLDISVHQAVLNIKRLGKGSDAIARLAK